jgi:hypothetical protein
MKTKPWPLMILAFLNFLGPTGNIFLSARLEHITIHQYLTEAQLVDFFPLLISPWIAAFAIFAVKKWSYPLFLATMAYQCGHLFYEAHSFPELLSLRLTVFISAVNFGLVSYFLSSRVRTVYYDQRLKWWESSPRYDVSAECLIGGKQGRDCKAQVLNISVGGVFLKCSKELEVGAEIELAFEAAHDLVFMIGKVLYARSGGYGIQFTHDRKRMHQMKDLIKHLRANGVNPITKISKMEDFRDWAKTKALKPTGWLPEVRIEKMLEEEKAQEQQKKEEEEEEEKKAA